MKFKFHLLIAFLILAFLAGSCRFSGYTAFHKITPKLSKPTVFSPDFSKALYKTELSLYGRTITGITVIKKVDDGYQLAMVSEVGLKYFEIFFQDDSAIAETKYLMPVLDRKPVKEALISSLGLLFSEANYNAHTRLKVNETKKTVLLINKEKGSRISYYYDPVSGEVDQMKQNKFFGSKTTIKMSAYMEDAPGSIMVYRGKISMHFQRL
jgi:hypothetical protein